MAGRNTGGVPAIDIADETFVVSPPEAVAAHLADPGRWHAWFPDLTMTVIEDRGSHGLRWTVAGSVTGTAEIWVEPVNDGAVIHTFLRGQVGSSLRPRAQRKASAEWALRVKRVAFGIKDALEGDRHSRPGTPTS